MHRRINFLWKLHYRYFKKLLLVVCETVFPEVNCKLAVYWISLAMQLNFHCCLQHQITNLYFIWLAKQQFVAVLTWFNRAKPGVWPITPKLMSSIIFMMLFFFLLAKILMKRWLDKIKLFYKVIVVPKWHTCGTWL